jgi:hypothetical protein
MAKLSPLLLNERMQLNSMALPWTRIESRQELPGVLAGQTIGCELVTDDANEWGYFKLPDGKFFLVGYANLGLPPVALIADKRLFVGINEVLACFDTETLEKRFSYRMPSVFYEFISLSSTIIVLDEIGFVGLSSDGQERWSFVVDGPVKKFIFDNGHIHGETIDDELFEFEVPS